ncbi:MAG: serine/threonine-protein kinase, partial [Planctomycetota bacterium]
PLPRDVQADLPPDLQAICMACLARNPRARPEPAQVAENLERFLAGKAILLRPVLYLNRLRREVKAHVGAVREWSRLGILTAAESDRLQGFYRRKVEAEECWRFDVHRLPGAQILMLAGNLLLVAAALLSYLYAPSGAFWLLPPVVGAALLSAGVWARMRCDWQAATSFFLGSVLAAVPATLATLSHLTAWSEPVRLLAASGAGLLISCTAWVWLQSALFAWTTAFLGASAYVAGMFVLGLAERPQWLQAVWLSPLISMGALGLLFENRRRHRWTLPFYGVGLAALFTLPFLAAMGKTLSVRALPSWIDGLHAVAALHGLALLAIGAALGRTRSLDLRWIARVLSVAAPLVLTGALFRNALLSGHPAAVASCGVAGLFFLALAAWRRRRVDLLAGLTGLALCSYLAFAVKVVSAAILAPALAVIGLALALGTYVRVRA